MSIRIGLLLLSSVAAVGCGAQGDACDAYPGKSCIALLVQAPFGTQLTVDQLALTANLGYALDGQLNPVSPRDPAVPLPITMALVPSADFNGVFSLRLVGLAAGRSVGRGMVSGSVTPGRHQRLAVTLTPDAVTDAGVDGGELHDLALASDFSVPDLKMPRDQAIARDLAANIGPSSDVAENVLNTWTVAQSASDTIEPCIQATLGTVSLAADTTKVETGTQAVRVDYGPDTHYYFDAAYPKTRDGGWNLTGRTGLEVWTTAQLPASYTAWQPVAPELILCGHGGGYRRLSPTANHEPRNSDPYVQLMIPLAGSAEWVKTDVGGFDISDVDVLEIHLNPQQQTPTTGAQTQVWFDGVRFY